MATPNQKITEFAASCYADPLKWVMFAWPWGEGRLVGRAPDTWQREFLEKVGREVAAKGFDGVKPVEPIRRATSSGHGIGKTALVAWLTHWVMSTRPYCKGTVTANTGDQLEAKTWAETCLWFGEAINAEWFDVSHGGRYIRHKSFPESWRVDALTWDERKPTAFAGQHSASSTPFYIFDEASEIPSVIWQTAEGGLTDGEPMFFAFGNPTLPRGYFSDCLDDPTWHPQEIDGRTCRMPNQALYRQWIEKYGEDSDFVRVRVRGKRPKAALGAYYGDEVEALIANKRFVKNTWDAGCQVYTVWDIGIGDATAILFWQVVGKEVRIIDSYSANGQGHLHFAKILTERPYAYQKHFLPFDADRKQLGDEDGLTLVEQLRRLGVKPIEALAKANVEPGIEAVRQLFPRLWVDSEKCQEPMAAWKAYRKKWDEKNQCWGGEVVDWTNHFADALRYLAAALEQVRGSSGSWGVDKKKEEEDLPPWFLDNRRGVMEAGWML